MVRTCTLRNWNPRPACGTAFRSVCISMSVCSRCTSSQIEHKKNLTNARRKGHAGAWTLRSPGLSQAAKGDTNWVVDLGGETQETRLLLPSLSPHPMNQKQPFHRSHRIDVSHEYSESHLDLWALEAISESIRASSASSRKGLSFRQRHVAL